MPAVQLRSAGSYSEYHEYEAPPPLDGDAVDAHFEVVHANNPWGFEVIDLRHDHVYTKGFFDIAAPGTGGGGDPITTAFMLCNPYADEYTGVIDAGPVDPVIRINGVFNSNVNLGGGFSGQNPKGVLWTDNGQAYYPTLTPGHGVRVGSAGAVRVVGKNPGKVDRILGCQVAQFFQSQDFGVLDVCFKNLTMLPVLDFTSVFSAPQDGNHRFGRLRVYDCNLKGNGTEYEGFGIKWGFRMQAAGCYDLRDVVMDHALEHFLYVNSVNSGLLDEDTWILRCSTPQGTNRTFMQHANRFEEQNAGPGRNTIFVKDCEILGCGQEHSAGGTVPSGGSNITFFGFHGTVILRDNYDGHMNPPGGTSGTIGQTRSILFWGAPNKAEPDKTEGSWYTASGGNHGTLVIINHRSVKPDCVDASVWGISGCEEVHIFEPHIEHGAKRGIEFDHVAGNAADPQFSATGVKGWDPDLSGPPGATVYSNNPYHTPTFKRNPVNGPGMTAGAIGPGYEHIYTPGASFAEWDGLIGAGIKLSRQDASQAYPDLEWDTLDPEDYWTPLDSVFSSEMAGSTTLTANLKVSVALSMTIAGDSTLTGILTHDSRQDDTVQLETLIRGDCELDAALKILVALSATIQGSTLVEANMDADPADTAQLALTIGGVASLAAALSARVALSCDIAGSSLLDSVLTVDVPVELVLLISSASSLACNLTADSPLSSTMDGSSLFVAGLTADVSTPAGTVVVPCHVETFVELEAEVHI